MFLNLLLECKQHSSQAYCRSLYNHAYDLSVSTVGYLGSGLGDYEAQKNHSADYKASSSCTMV